MSSNSTPTEVEEKRWYLAPDGWERKLKPRTVFLPPEHLDRCSVCQGIGVRLRLCASCGEAIYCSKECQGFDWPEHKKTCGKTDRIDFRSFFAFLAVLFEIAVGHPERPLHPALTHQVINSPNPVTGPFTQLSDGTSALLVKLGKEIEHNPKANEWWSPSNRMEAYMLYYRILREGWLLPNYFGICLALLAEIYTTTSIPASSDEGIEAESRIRLNVYTSPLTDFGIVKGVVDVKGQDRLAYQYPGDDKPTMGQDPKDHFWMYFKTIRGMEYHLDCGLYTFNNREVVSDIKQYAHDLEVEFLQSVPASWKGKEALRHLPETHTIKKRFSFLRDPRLHQVIRNPGLHFENQKDRRVIGSILEEIAERKCSATEKELAIRYTVQNRMSLITVLMKRSWVNWPEEPLVEIEDDPQLKKERRQAEDMVFLIDLMNQVKTGKIREEDVGKRQKAYMKARGRN